MVSGVFGLGRFSRFRFLMISSAFILLLGLGACQCILPKQHTYYIAPRSYALCVLDRNMKIKFFMANPDTLTRFRHKYEKSFFVLPPLNGVVGAGGRPVLFWGC